MRAHFPALPQDPSVVADPTQRGHIFGWKLTQTIDPCGNRIDYEYMRDAGKEGPHHWDQLYLQRVSYGDYTTPGQTQYVVSVTFDYEDRPDAFSEYRAGFEIRTRKRCQQIAVRTHAEGDRLVRTYHLSYRDPLPLNGVSLLSQLTVVGHDDDRTEALPPLTFGYTQCEFAGRDFFPLYGKDLPVRSLANPELELADLFGHGLPDILEMNGTVRYWRNLGQGRFDLPREMREAPASLQLADPGVQLIDADGDGRIDLLVSTNGVSGYFPLRFGGLWERRAFQRYEFAPSFNLEDPEVKLLDLNGDGVTDALRSGSRLECFFNDLQHGWQTTRVVERRALEEFPNIHFSDSRVRCADMTGDGLHDIVLVYDGCVAYWPSLGWGDWAPRVTMHNSPRFPNGYDPKRILVGDVDGDGLADLVYVDNTKVMLWLNQSGNRWSDPIEIQGTPPISDLDAVRLVDLLGTGISGILWSTDASGLSQSNLCFLDYTGGVKPYLLHEMDNHMGAVTRVAYAPSTQYYLEDEQHPASRWQTPLPFPVHVVARVEVIDQISHGKLTTEYSYHHGYWDGAEREFRGFGRVDQRDTEVFAHFNAAGLHADRPFAQVESRMFLPPMETRTWFHQGPLGDAFGEWDEADYSVEYWSGDPQALPRPQSMVDALKALPRRARRDALRALRGRVLRTEVYALDGTARQHNPYTVTESLHGVREEQPPEAGEAERWRIFFPHLLAQRTTQWERGNDPMTQCTFTEDYDAYGQPQSQTSIAVPRGRDYRVAAAAGEPYLATQTVTTYAHRDEAQHYLIGRVARTTNYEIRNDGAPSMLALHAGILDGTATRRILGQTLHFYDGPAFQGLPFGQLGDHGLVSRTESLVLTPDRLQEAYRSGATVQTPPELPPYLVPGSAPAWSNEYPQEFRDRLAPLAGYLYQSGSVDAAYAPGYFVATERRRYDYQESPDGQGRGLLTATRDPLGHDTIIHYDAYDLLPVEVTDPADLTTQARYDYRVFQPQEITDPNGNRTAAGFTPLGLLECRAVMGKVGESVGDTLDAPGSWLAYDFLAFVERGAPISVRTITRVHHANDTDVPLPERQETIESMEYSDGFGRLLQTRTQAEDITFGDAVFGDAGLPADQSLPVGNAVGQPRATDAPPRVVVSGWQIYDNKGRVVEKYEPFFSTGFDYAPPTEAQLGQKAAMHYDPRGRVIRTVNPDGSEQRVLFGIPADVAQLDEYVPTPWEAYTYDANDNAGRTHATAATGYQHHWNTPTSVVVDALGRTIENVARNGPNPATDWLITRSTYDIQGNLLTVTDALGRVAFRYVYDLAKHPLRTESIDAGLRRMVLDAVGNPVEGRDGKGALVLHAYDLLHRLIRLWSRDGSGELLTLRECLGNSQELRSQRLAF